MVALTGEAGAGAGERHTLYPTDSYAMQVSRITRRRHGLDWGLVAAALVAVFIIQPLWHPGLPGTADAPIHLYRTLEFALSLTPDSLYPRWAPHLAYGYGLPYWVFVPPLPYVLPLPFWVLGLSLAASLKASVMLMALLYAMGAYLLARDHLGRPAGVVAAAAYTLAPFALREVLLYGGNYPQYLAIGLFPWLLWSAGRLARGGSWGSIVLTALLVGAVVLSHLFHALVVTPAAMVYCLLIWLVVSRAVRRLAEIAVSFALGLAWTAFFWLPALLEREWTHAVEERYLTVSPLTLRFLDGREFLALPQPLDAACANPWVPFALHPVTLLLAGLGLLALVRWRHCRQVVVVSAFSFAIAAVGVFMTLPQSQWLWLNVPLLAVAEFPWRLLGLVNVGLAFLAGAACLGASSPPSVVGEDQDTGVSSGVVQNRMIRAIRDAFPVLATVAVWLGAAVYLYPPRPFDHYGEQLADLARYELTTRTIGLTTLGEYVPRWVDKMPTSSPLAEALAQGTPWEDLTKLDPDSLPDGARAVHVSRTAASDTYELKTSQPFQARLRTFYFPGWQAELDGRPAPIVVESSTGLITVSIPAGTHTLRLWFGNTPLRTVSDGVSLITIAVLAVASLWRGWRRMSARPRSAVTAWQVRRVSVWREETSSHDSSCHDAPLADTWSLRAVVAVLFLIVMVKGLVVDPHTGWFRRHSPPGQVSDVQHPLRIDLDGRFWLLGYDLDQDTVAQGDTLRVVLYWQAQQRTSTNYRPFVHLDAPTDQRTWAISDNFHPGDATAQIELPTGTWDTQRYVRDEHQLTVPAYVPPVAFNLRAGLYDPGTGVRIRLADGSGDTIALQTVRVTRGQRLTLTDLANRVDFRLGDAIWLRGYDLKPSGRELVLYWQAERAVNADVVVFVHLLDNQNRRVWGADTPPLGGLYPSTDWQPGEVVADPRPLQWGDLSPGEYLLVTGMYEAETQSRLPVFDASGAPVKDNVVRLVPLAIPLR
jgi:hypothetical protein